MVAYLGGILIPGGGGGHTVIDEIAQIPNVV